MPTTARYNLRMENEQFEENKPLETAPGAVENSADETRPMQAQPEPRESASPVESHDLDQTMATPVVNPDPVNLSDTLVGMSALIGYEDTGPVPLEPAPIPPDAAVSQAAPAAKPPAVSKRYRSKGLPWFFFPLIGLAVLLAVLLLSGFGGYSAGISQRKHAEGTQVAQAIGEQYQLGLEDMQQGAYSRALQRFQYVVENDPNYPGVTEKLAEVLLEINTTATPTLLPTTTLTPTPDTRGSQQLFDQAQQALAGSDWDGAIEHLLAMRKSDPGYRTVEIDGMLFLALRNRGRDKILKEADLEGGIYDLTLAKKFGPLDSEADGLLTWSSLYITGASFWEIDWEQVVNYFSQVAPQLPNLTDGSGMTATERLRLAYFEYGNLLASRGQYCKAVRAYQDSLAIAPDPDVQAAGELAAKGCEGGDGVQTQTTPKPNKKPKATPNP